MTRGNIIRIVQVKLLHGIFPVYLKLQNIVTLWVPSNRGKDISLKTTNVNFMLALQEKSGNHQSHKAILKTINVPEHKKWQSIQKQTMTAIP